MKRRKRIRTVLYGDQVLFAPEVDLLHTPALQRLYDLHQLGLTDRVYIDASHSRLHHVVGVLEQADRIMNAIVRNLSVETMRRDLKHGLAGGCRGFSPKVLAEYVESRRAQARLMGLLHDLTHAPYGHTLEDEIHLVQSKHDCPTRQAEAFYHLLCQYIGWTARDRFDLGTSGSSPFQHASTEDYLDAPDLERPPSINEVVALGVAVWRSPRPTPSLLSSDEFVEVLRELHFSMTALLHLELLHKHQLSPEHVPRKRYDFQTAIEDILIAVGHPMRDIDKFDPHRDAFLLDVIGNTICADLLDYARRDAFYCGLKLDFDLDRTVENFTLVSTEFPARSMPTDSSADQCEEDPFAGYTLRTAVGLFTDKLRGDVPGQIMGLLQARFHIYERALFHPTKAVAGAMLGSALQLIGWRELPPHLRYTGDAVFLHQSGVAARLVRDLLGQEITTDQELFCSERLARRLVSKLETMPRSGENVAAIQLINDRVASSSNTLVSEVLSDVNAGIGLLDRLAARRYYRPVFRMLPNAHIGAAKVLREDDVGRQPAELVAKVFLDAEKRKVAEREIERRTGLPRGCVVIHCPPYRGPAKIANILLLSIEENGDEKLEPLRNVGLLLDGDFKEHQKAVEALQSMYGSMWRLVVCVAPAHLDKFRELSSYIAQFLKEYLTAGAEAVFFPDVEVQNDASMLRELEGLHKQTGSVDERPHEVVTSDVGSAAYKDQPLQDKQSKTTRAFTLREVFAVLKPFEPEEPKKLKSEVLPKFVELANHLSPERRERLRRLFGEAGSVIANAEAVDSRLPLKRAEIWLYSQLKQVEA